MAIDIKKRFHTSFKPIGFIYYGFCALLHTIALCIWKLELSTLVNFTKLREAAFRDLFVTLRHGFIKFEDTTEIPELVSSAYGKVLELGPAVGNQLQRFQISKIEHIYGVEANKEFEKDLREKVETLKIGDKYTPIMCKLEDVEILREYGVKEGSMDCIVSIQVLCSVSDVEKAAKVLYRLLKPGGQLIFWEHQRSSDRLTRFLQKLWNIPWTLAMDGCHLDNEIEKSLLDAGSWIGFGLDRTKDPYDLTPRVWGKLTKAGD